MMNADPRDFGNAAANEARDEARTAAAGRIIDGIHRNASASEVEEAFRQAAMSGVSFGAANWFEFAEATSRTKTGQLLDCVWAAFARNPAPLDAAAWKSFAQAATACNDAFLLQRLWSMWLESAATKTVSEWIRFARAAARLGDGDLVGEIWRDFARADLDIRSSGWHVFFEAAAVTESTVLEEMWRAWESKRVPLSATTWYSLAKAAGTSGQRETLESIWKASQDTGINFALRTWVAFVEAARKCDARDLLWAMWSSWQSSAAALKRPGWGAFAHAAGAIEQVELLQLIWRTWKQAGPGFDSKSLGVIANAAGLVEHKDLVRKIWAECQLVIRPPGVDDINISFEQSRTNELGSRTWGSIAAAVSRTEDGELLCEIWQAWTCSGEQLDPKGWGTFVNAAVNTGQIDLIAPIWTAFKESQTLLSSRNWTVFATAAGKSGSGDLVRDMWATCRSSGATLEEPTFGAFACAAGNTAQSDLVPEIWATSQGTGRTPASWTWGALANAAAKTHSGPLAHELWNAVKQSGTKLDAAGLGTFAAAAGSAEQGDLLEDVWSACREADTPLGSRTWGTLATAAGDTGRADLLEEVWRAWRTSGEDLEPLGWASFARATGDVWKGDLLAEVWCEWKPTGDAVDGLVWGAMASAAEKTRRISTLEEIVRRCIATEVSMPHRTWGWLANSVANADRADLLHEIWHKCLASDLPPDAATIGSFAHAARLADGSQLLEEVFDSWNPQSDTLIRAEHLTWSSLMLAALALDDEPLFLKIFLRLESLYDPIRLPHRGSLQHQLWGIARRLQSPAVRSDVVETLKHLRLDLRRCFHTLRISSPASATGRAGRFEGAGRCLMTWLINSYFQNDAAEFERRLGMLVDGILSLEHNHAEAWHAMLCRGQGAFAGCLAWRASEHLEQALAPVAALSDEELASTLERRDGESFERIRTFYLHDVDSIPTPQSKRFVPPDAAARRLEPLIEFIVDSHRDFLIGNPSRGSRNFFDDAWGLLKAASPSNLSREDWMDALHMLLERMTRSVWNHISRTIKHQVHSHKNELEILARELRDAADPRERRHLARVGREALLSFSRHLGGFRVSEPIPININYHIRRLLLGKQPESRTVQANLPEGRIFIGGWEGVTGRVLRPLFREIRLNAETALKHLPMSDQFFQVQLELGSGPEQGFAVLAVSNSYDPSAPSDQFSTRRGTHTIQLLATVLRRESLQGYAWSETETDEQGRNLHTWWIVMPCWDEQTAQVSRATG